MCSGVCSSEYQGYTTFKTKENKTLGGKESCNPDSFVWSTQFLEIILGFSAVNFTSFFFLSTISTCPFLVYLKLVGVFLFSRSSLLRSVLQPESVRLDWLCLAVSRDAPQRANTMDAEGNPR